MDMRRCRCGNPLLERRETRNWKDNQGQHYTITNVPMLYCSDESCPLVYHGSQSLWVTSLLTELMEEGKIPHQVDYLLTEKVIETLEF